MRESKLAPLEDVDKDIKRCSRRNYEGKKKIKQALGNSAAIVTTSVAQATGEVRYSGSHRK